MFSQLEQYPNRAGFRRGKTRASGVFTNQKEIDLSRFGSERLVRLWNLWVGRLQLPLERQHLGQWPTTLRAGLLLCGGRPHDAQRVLELDTLWGYAVWGCARNWRTIGLADGCPTPAAQHTGGPCGNPPPMLSCSTGGHRQHSSVPRRRGRRRNGFPSNASKLLWLPRERGDSPTSTHTCCGPLLA